MTAPKSLYDRWINELWAGEPVAAEVVSDDFIGHWPDREVHGPDELQAIIEETRKMLADLTFAIEIAPMVEEFRWRRDYVVERLNRLPGVTCVKPEGAFYAFPNVSALYARRWVGSGRSDQGPMSFTGNDILRFKDGRFVEYWTGTSAG